MRGLVSRTPRSAPTNALLQSFVGKCLDVNGASTTPGTSAIDYDCHGQTNQRWTLTAGGAMQVYGNRCLTPVGGVVAAGTAVVIDLCTGSPAQTWSYAAGTGRLTDGVLCLEVTGANPNNLAPTQTRDLQRSA